MALLQIVRAPAAILKTKAAFVERVDDSIKKLMDDMVDTMYKNNGCGLAAPQVNVSKRVICVDVTENKSQVFQMANPEIVWCSEETQVNREGCLSFPGQSVEVQRAFAVKVRYLDYDNRTQELEASGLLGCCFQHEIDHINGKLFIDHLSKAKQQLIIERSNRSRARG